MKAYKNPTVEWIEIETRDVLTTSVTVGEGLGENENLDFSSDFGIMQ